MSLTITDMEDSIVRARETALAAHEEFKQKFFAPVEELDAALQVKKFWSAIPAQVKVQLLKQNPTAYEDMVKKYGG